jgi:hypothetical protein
MQTPTGAIKGWLMQYAAKLRYPKLLALTVGLFILNLFVPDLVPWVDEILLALVSLLLAGLKSRHTNDSP